MNSQLEKQQTVGSTFLRPERPIGVRIFNWLGERSRRAGWRHELSVSEILAKARRRTGMSAWGDEYFLEPLDILVRDLEREASLNSFGRAMLRGILTGVVENRLRIHDYLRRYPEALQVQLAPALIVLGMPRTGTTLLHNLLAQDPRARPLMGWESFWPVPRSRHWDNRRRTARLAEMGMARVAPALRQIHPLHTDGPEECTWLMANTLVSPVFSMLARVPAYEEWLWSRQPSDWAAPYDDYVAQLRVLQHQRSGGHWVLKSPVHFMALDTLLNAIPDARIILTERDPRNAVPSTCSLFAVMRGIGSDHVEQKLLGNDVVKRLAEGANRSVGVAVRQPDKVARVAFEDLVNDKLGTLRGIYHHFGMTFTASASTAMKDWLAMTRHEDSHRYSLDQFGITEAMLAESFRQADRVTIR